MKSCTIKKPTAILPYNVSIVFLSESNFTTIILLLKILALRPNLKDMEVEGSRNKICVSFFLSADNLNLEKYKISVQDPYLAFWIKQLKPLYIEDDVYKKFVHANKWIFIDQKYHDREQRIYLSNYKRRVRKSIWKGLLDRLVTVVDEKIYKHIQLTVMPKQLKRAACALDPQVVISDTILKLHFPDQRLILNKTCGG